MTSQRKGVGGALSALLAASKNTSRAMMITQAARLIFSAYREDDFADAELFVMQLGIVLERYPDDVIVLVSDPLVGIQRRLKKPPSLAQIVEACEDEMDRRPESQKPLAIEPPIDPVMKARVDVLFADLSKKLHADADEARGLTIKAMAEEKKLPLAERVQRQRKRQMA